MNNNKSLDHQTFNRLSRIYIIALGAIALFTIGGQFFIQQFLDTQIKDAEIINISGRQRMLSQKLSKETLIITTTQDKNLKNQYITSLATTLGDWKTSHQMLKAYNDSTLVDTDNSNEIRLMFDRIEPYFTTIYEHSNLLIDYYKNEGFLETPKITSYTNTIIKTEPFFLVQMDAIVLQYEKNAQEKVASLKRIEMILFGLISLILVLEFLLLFRPINQSIKKTISVLLVSENNSKQMAANTEKLRKLQEKNMKELVSLTYALDKTLLYARIDQDGVVLSLGDRFAKILGVEINRIKKNITELIPLSETDKNKLLQLISQNKGAILNEEFQFIPQNGSRIWLDVSILPVFKEKGIVEHLVLCTEISKRKEAQEKIEQLQAAQYKEQEEIQKSRSSQIVEAQEEERKRIAREIHDSIGQMLTGLKFNIESINTKNLEKTEKKIEDLKQLSKDLIRGVRMATFNLTPPELTDYGVPSALQKMTLELSKLTGKEVLFENKSNFDLRLDSLVETNLYRVTQEAINNAIKYASSDYILVTMNHSNKVLSITINDNGKGFDISKVPAKPKNASEGGMGLFFMKERMNYIDGRIFINSQLGEGTRITINYNIPH